MPTQRIDADQLFDALVDQIESDIEISFLGHVFSFGLSNLATAKSMLLGLTQNAEGNYYGDLFEAQREDKDKLKDESLSEEDRAEIRSRLNKTELDIQVRYLQKDLPLLESNIRYLEGLFNLEKGGLRKIVKAKIEQTDQRRLEAGSKPLSAEQKEELVPKFVGQLKLLVQNAIAASEKKISDLAAKKVEETMNREKTNETLIDRTKAMHETDTEENENSLKLISVRQ